MFQDEDEDGPRETPARREAADYEQEEGSVGSAEESGIIYNYIIYKIFYKNIDFHNV